MKDHEGEAINNEQRLKIIKGAKLIAEALNISEMEIFEAIRNYGNITEDEAFMLRISVDT